MQYNVSETLKPAVSICRLRST